MEKEKDLLSVRFIPHAIHNGYWEKVINYGLTEEEQFDFYRWNVTLYLPPTPFPSNSHKRKFSETLETYLLPPPDDPRDNDWFKMDKIKSHMMKLVQNNYGIPIDKNGNIKSVG